MHDFKLFPELTNSQLDFYYWDSPHVQITEDFSGIVAKVTDGDTIRVTTNFRDFDTVVRFINIDSPERDTSAGVKSKKWLTEKLLGEEIEILINPKQRVGKWGRMLGVILHEGNNINEESLDLGFSTPFGRSEKW